MAATHLAAVHHDTLELVPSTTNEGSKTTD
jgi:hypothetical protein